MDLVQRSKEELVDILNEIQTSKRYGAKHTHTNAHRFASYHRLIDWIGGLIRKNAGR